jgi:uridine kinase
MEALIIGIAGGSGSGKTTIAEKIIEAVGADRVGFLGMDSYYNDLSHMTPGERAKCNFDHPSSYDTELFIQHIKALKSGSDIERPQYDFVSHTRSKETVTIKARHVLILEGILLFENFDVRKLIDVKTFVETPSDTRFIRRLLRDIKERGRTPESVAKQYYATVRPMYKTFVAPTKEYADIIIPWQDYNDVPIDMVISRIEYCLRKKQNN